MTIARREVMGDEGREFRHVLLPQYDAGVGARVKRVRHLQTPGKLSERHKASFYPTAIRTLNESLVSLVIVYGLITVLMPFS